MSTAKHSAPPWRVTPTGYVVNSVGNVICRLNHWPLQGYAHTMRDEQAMADSKLISRAPELLHMCAGLQLVLDATGLYVPAGAHPSIDIMLDSSATLLRDIAS